jgi:hypothetical protein
LFKKSNSNNSAYLIMIMCYMPGMEDFKDDLELELELKREEIHQEKGLWLCLIVFKAICDVNAIIFCMQGNTGRNP